MEFPDKAGFFSFWGGKELRALPLDRPGERPDQISEEEFWRLVTRSQYPTLPPGTEFFDSEGAPLVEIPGKVGFFSPFGGAPGEMRPIGRIPGREPDSISEEAFWRLVARSKYPAFPRGTLFFDSEDAPLVRLPGRPGYFSFWGGKELRALGPDRPGERPDLITEERFWQLVKRSKCPAIPEGARFFESDDAPLVRLPDKPGFFSPFNGAGKLRPIGYAPGREPGEISEDEFWRLVEGSKSAS